jgi:Holliday junction DNA helicase RuvA
VIGKLRGKVDSVRDDYLILDVGGVGYLVFASSRTLSVVEPVQGEVSLIIETHVREDHIHLYGFMNEAEREWFRLLTSVQGVGARVALAIMGAFSTEEIATIIGSQDKVMMTRAAGVGKKLAERIVIELKSKVAALPTSPVAGLDKPTGKALASAVIAASSVRDEAVSALVNLGYTKVDAFAAVARAQQAGADALEDLIRQGLKELMR